MNVIEYSEADHRGLADALTVARTGHRSDVSSGDEKMLGFFLHEGHCDGRIGTPLIEVWFSWLQKRKPSTYFGSLSPGLITQLMDLGGIQQVDDTVRFHVGPATTGNGVYRFSFPSKWVYIRCSDDSIVIRIRDSESELETPMSEASDW